MFDYTGYTEETLQILCDERNINKGRCKWRFWPIEAYSIGHCLRAQTGYPSWLTLYAYSAHGVSYGSIGYPHEINNKAKAMFVFNEVDQDAYSRKSNKPCYVITMPYVWYRQSKGYRQMTDAHGTLAFPAHSTAFDHTTFDIDGYIDMLMELPGEFHPICVCLHQHDITRGYHHKFIERGMPVYTAGHQEDIGFVDRFYRILRRFKYTTSNVVGSYAYYSTEMGIPFSLLGKDVLYVNESNPSMVSGEVFSDFRADYQYYGVDHEVQYREAMEVFSGLCTSVGDKQRDFVHHVMGIGRGLNRDELRDVLWKCAFSSKSRLVRDTGKAVIAALRNHFSKRRRNPLLEQLAMSD